MTDLRTAAQQALEALTSRDGDGWTRRFARDRAIEALEAALAEPEGGGNLPPPLQEPTVKESLQVESAVAKNATTQQQLEEAPPSDYRRGYWDGFAIGKREGRIEAEKALVEPDDEPTYCPKCGEEDGWPCGLPDCGLRCGAEPVQEPVAWSYELATTMLEHGYDGWEHRITRYKPNVPEASIRNLTPLYTAPPRKPLTEPVQEPVAWMVYTEGGTSAYVTDNPNDLIGAYRALPLYTSPPQRLPLTEEEIDSIWDSEKAFADIYAIARAIERAHGITP